jgi:hypothetical protein
LFSYIVFDTWGDATGWQEAIIPSMILLIVPTLLLTLPLFYRFVNRLGHSICPSKNSPKTDKDLEGNRSDIECRDLSSPSIPALQASINQQNDLHSSIN